MKICAASQTFCQAASPHKYTLAFHLKSLGSHQLPKSAQIEGGIWIFHRREQPLDVLAVAPIVYDKSTEGKHRDPDSLCFHRVGLRSVLIRPTAAFESIVNPVRLLGSKPRGLKHGESTSGTAGHMAELSCWATCEGLPLIPSCDLWFLSHLVNNYREMSRKTQPPRECPCLYWKNKESLLWEGLESATQNELGNLCHRWDQSSLVNVSVFHRGIINNNYYKVPLVFFFSFFFSSFSLLPFIIEEYYQYLWILYC